MRMLLALLLVLSNPARAALYMGDAVLAQAHEDPEMDRGLTHTGPTAPLDDEVPLERGLESLDWLARTQGVALGAVAQGQGVQVAGMRYDPVAPDGQRLVVDLVDTHGQALSVRAELYDWQLLPLIAYAAHDQASLVTTHGQMADPIETSLLRENAYEIIGLHPALQDTLLGLRLFQASVMILYPAATDLPHRGQEPFTGPGEPAHDGRAAKNALLDLHEHFARAGEPTFQGFVITDHGQALTYGVQEGRLVLQGEPAWHCWRMADSSAEERLELHAEATERAVGDGLVCVPRPDPGLQVVGELHRALGSLVVEVEAGGREDALPQGGQAGEDLGVFAVEVGLDLGHGAGAVLGAAEPLLPVGVSLSDVEDEELSEFVGLLKGDRVEGWPMLEEVHGLADSRPGEDLVCEEPLVGVEVRGAVHLTGQWLGAASSSDAQDPSVVLQSIG